MSLKIIAGQRRGAVLQTPHGENTRPTLGRVRESLFMILAPELPGARVLDVFAGCGALGFEALSRGAAHATFVEKAHPALVCLRANITKLRYEPQTDVAGADALAWLGRPPAQPFDLILLDPPYAQDLGERCLQKLGQAAAAWLAPDGLAVMQAGKTDPLADAYGHLTATRRQVYGQTQLVFYRPMN